MMTTVNSATQHAHTLELAAAAIASVPPLWPLDSSVAVNPFLGQTHLDLATTGAHLGRVAGVPVTMPRAWYHQRILAGDISDRDLAETLANAPARSRPANVAELKQASAKNSPKAKPLPTVADLAASIDGMDWPAFLAERFGVWAAAYLDRGQALWAAPRSTSAFAAWRAFASRDLTPEIMGLSGFAAHIENAPQRAEEVILRAVYRLGLDQESLDTYFHQLLMTLGGWAQSARYRLWQAELDGGWDSTGRDFLAIRLMWEEALFAQYETRIATQWQSVRAAHAVRPEPEANGIIDAILQEAFERASQRALAATLEAQPTSQPQTRPALQAAFCIDVRSEVFRRALESVDPDTRTLGFAGFFGIPTAHRRFASDLSESRLPVLLTPAVSSCATGPENAEADKETRFKSRAIRAWNRFKLAAVSSFAFVEATGPIYMAKLVRDAIGVRSPSLPSDPPPRFDPELSDDARVDTSEKILRAMSLTSNFARLVLLTGHGARVVNNAHASALHCGACGGYSGEVNARLLAQLLNDPTVRQGLAERAIEIPEDTLFLGALHDTTTDAVVIFEDGHDTQNHQEDLRQARAKLAKAGAMTRTERALRLPGARKERHVTKRSQDWAEVRPEWALAGCKAFIAAPRHRTVGKSLEGRAFLHDYDWQQDDGFGVLELILTAPVVVASWISLQYYGSTVAPETFGGGNKLLHNVVGGMGVVEGNGGVLRPGLPWQSVHDGERYIHEPLRLSVCIEAPTQAITDILEKHENVRQLFDNRWLHLFALDEHGSMAWRYAGNLEWQPTAEQNV
ncbi:MAG: DUF2309 domain-containing protein [Marinobacter sp.]|uniref:YbcC family protein n=1 Tax=Marinobacter sp. TaxID=50741 RepID=UPI00299E0293|nr:DUF2309 domain-containing protein [Marinobacter sp.]MDX1634081.1 DUF2309 domain-containing protein [Marinobacter sp.]